MITFKEFLKERLSSVEPTEKFISTNLIRYIREDDLEKVKEELDKGADINHDYGNGWTPMHYASRERSDRMALFLLKNGAYIDATVENTGDTPLILACKVLSIKCIKTLVKEGADIAIENKLYKTAYDIFNQYAEEEMDKKEILEMLKV